MKNVLYTLHSVRNPPHSPCFSRYYTDVSSDLTATQVDVESMQNPAVELANSYADTASSATSAERAHALVDTILGSRCCVTESMILLAVNVLAVKS